MYQPGWPYQPAQMEADNVIFMVEKNVAVKAACLIEDCFPRKQTSTESRGFGIAAWARCGMIWLLLRRQNLRLKDVLSSRLRMGG